MPRTMLLLTILLGGLPLPARAEDRPAKLVSVQKIWDKAPHNAFTDLVRFQDRWFCVFREGKSHVSPEGALRVITSRDGKDWTSAALVTSEKADLRDAKITVTPDGRLMLNGAGALHPPADATHQSYAWFSDDGRAWSDPFPVADPGVWLWRVTWHDGTAYGVGYSTGKEKFVRLYRSKDGTSYETLVKTLFDEGYPNETALVFLPDDTCLCLLRRDGGSGTAQLGKARPPYKEWSWTDLGVRIGGPSLIRLPDGRLVAGVRLYDGKVRTALCWLDPDGGTLREFLTLPSGGDTSYPGLVWHDNRLWVSYYSSHEGKTAIYFAEVTLPEPEETNR